MINTRKNILLILKRLSAFCISAAFACAYFNKIMWFNIAGQYIFFVIFIIVSFVYLFKGKKCNNNTFFLLYLIWSFFCTCSALVAIVKSNPLEIGHLYSFFLWSLILLLVTQMNYSEKEISIIKWGCIIGGLSMALLVIIFKVRYYPNDATRYTVKLFYGEKADPNYLGSYLATSLIITYSFLIWNKKKIFLFIICGIICIGVIMTGSRGAIVYISIPLVCSFIDWYRLFIFQHKKHYIFFLVYAIILAFGGCCVIVYHYYPEIFTRLFLKIEEYFTDGSNQLRIQHWVTGLKTIVEAPILGHGISEEIVIVEKVLRIKEISHNTWLSFYIRLGLGGILTMLMLFGTLIFRFLRQRVFLYLGMTLGLFINIFIISAPMSYITWMPIILLTLFSMKGSSHHSDCLFV